MERPQEELSETTGEGAKPTRLFLVASSDTLESALGSILPALQLKRSRPPTSRSQIWSLLSLPFGQLFNTGLMSKYEGFRQALGVPPDANHKPQALNLKMRHLEQPLGGWLPTCNSGP